MPCKRAQLLSPVAAAFWTGPAGGVFVLHSLGRLWGSSRSAVGSTRLVWNAPAFLALCRRIWSRAALREFHSNAVCGGSRVFWSSQQVQPGHCWGDGYFFLCFQIPVFHHHHHPGSKGSKALQKQGREALLTLLVCVFLLGFYPHFYLNFYSTEFLPASSKLHLFEEKILVLLLSIIDFGL